MQTTHDEPGALGRSTPATLQTDTISIPPAGCDSSPTRETLDLARARLFVMDLDDCPRSPPCWPWRSAASGHALKTWKPSAGPLTRYRSPSGPVAGEQAEESKSCPAPSCPIPAILASTNSAARARVAGDHPDAAQTARHEFAPRA